MTENPFTGIAILSFSEQDNVKRISRNIFPEPAVVNCLLFPA